MIETLFDTPITQMTLGEILAGLLAFVGFMFLWFAFALAIWFVLVTAIGKAGNKNEN